MIIYLHICHFFLCVSECRWMRTSFLRSTNCSTDAVAPPTTRTPTSEVSASFCCYTWTLIQITFSGCVHAARDALSGAHGVSHRPDTQRSQHTVHIRRHIHKNTPIEWIQDTPAKMKLTCFTFMSYSSSSENI